jgi:hypothetical protein
LQKFIRPLKLSSFAHIVMTNEEIEIALPKALQILKESKALDRIGLLSFHEGEID